MYLKRLEINGFKSFANKTVLDFLPPKSGRFSITGVVGPNGSGKSNVTDAIRWVMGETSLKNIRGKKSEDVIFSGSEAKGQLGMAEVTMIMDNSDKKLDYDYEEIVVTRRIYRSGESEYLINNSQARLLDVHLLFAKAQIAQNSSSIVGQGTIDKLLLVSPADRKNFLDEAAGIKEHQIKQHQAKLKLARTEDNMEQARQLVQEIEPHLRLLSRQVKKLSKRQEVEIELREVQESYYATIFKNFDYQKEKNDLDLKEVESVYKKHFNDLEKIQGELAELARSSTRQELFDELQVKHQQAVNKKNQIERDLAVLDGQMHGEYSKTGNTNIGWIENKIKDVQSQKQFITDKVENIKKNQAKLESTIKEIKEKIEVDLSDRSRIVLEISKLQTEMFASQTEKNYREFSGLETVKNILENKNKFGKIHGLVAELGEVDEEYRLAIEVAAGSHISSLVVGDEDVARLAINYLRENRLGTATFLPLEKIKGRPDNPYIYEFLNEDGVIGLATDLVKNNSKFDSIFSFVLGNTLVVKDLKTANRIGVGRARMVTLQGDLVERNSVMRGGYRKSRFRGLSFTGRLSLSEKEKTQEYQTRINVLQQNLQDLESKIDSSKNNLSNEEADKKALQAQTEIVGQEKESLIKEESLLERELKIIKNPEDLSKFLSELEDQKNVLIKDKEKIAKDVQSLEKDMKEFNEKEEAKKQKVFDLQNQMQSKQIQVNEILEKRNNLKIELARLETKIEDLSEEINNELSLSILSLKEREIPTVKSEALNGLVDKIQKLKYQLSLIGGIDEEVVTEYEQTKERFDFLSSQLEDLEKATKDLGKMIEELDDIMKKKRKTAFKKIREEFDRYFKILFDGGSAKLEEIYGEEIDEDDIESSDEEEKQTKKRAKKVLSGIDIIANPPGKKIKHLNALSGGERTLTSIALICAILSCNPSPFVILDEVEAALDEANSMRFNKIMTELSTKSQFIVITHNRVTMHSADALYGVVMGGDGMSKLVSVKIEDVPN